MNALVRADKIKKYAEKTTSPKIPEEAFIVSAFLKSFFVRESYSNSNEPGFIEAFDRIKENVQKFLLLNSYGTDASEFTDEPFYSILRYSLNKKNILLFQMIQEAFWGTFTDIPIYINMNRSIDDVRYTDLEAPDGRDDCEEWDGKLWYCTDTLNLYTDMNNINPNLGIPTFYVKDYFGSSATENEKNKYVKEKDYDAVYTKYTRFISLVKPARYSILNNTCPIYELNLTRTDTLGTTGYLCGFFTRVVENQQFSEETWYKLLECTNMNFYRTTNYGNFENVKAIFSKFDQAWFIHPTNNRFRTEGESLDTVSNSISVSFEKKMINGYSAVTVKIVLAVPPSFKNFTTTDAVCFTDGLVDAATPHAFIMAGTKSQTEPSSQVSADMFNLNGEISGNNLVNIAFNITVYC